MSGKVWEESWTGKVVYSRGDHTKARGHRRKAQPQTEVLCGAIKGVKAGKVRTRLRRSLSATGNCFLRAVKLVNLL